MRSTIVLPIITLLLCLPVNAKNIKLQNIYITDTSEAEAELEQDNEVLKGYAEYMENSDAIILKDDDDQFVLNIKVPQKITSKRFVDEYSTSFTSKPLTYSKFGSEEYQITPTGKNAVLSAGGISFGTTFDQDVDLSELEHTAGVFSAYNKGRFKIQTSYKRTIGSTYSKYTDNIYFTPEIKINDMFSVKQVMSANVLTRVKKSEFVLSIKPLIYTKEDRLDLEIGAGNTYSDNNELIRSRIRFSTRFRL